MLAVLAVTSRRRLVFQSARDLAIRFNNRVRLVTVVVAFLVKSSTTALHVYLIIADAIESS